MAETKVNSNQIYLNAANKFIGRVTAGAGIAEEIDITAYGRNLIAAASVAAQRTLLGFPADSIGYLTNDGAGNFSYSNHGRVTFTNTGNNNFVVPAGITSVFVTLVGGGGGGAGAHNSGGLYYAGGGGGGSPMIAETRVAVTPGNTYVAFVGSGGAGRTDDTAGDDGTASSFTNDDNTITGGYGHGGAAATGAGKGTEGSSMQGSRFGIPGEGGAAAHDVGGASPMGENGSKATGYGGGGNGSGTHTVVGATGKNGIVIIEW